MFNESVTGPIRHQPWRYTEQPTYDGQTQLTPGVKEFMPAVLILVDPAIIARLRALLTTNARRTLFDSWTLLMTAAEAAEWHVKIWSGNASAVFIRVPTSVWAKWDAAVPAQVKTFFADLYSETV